MTRAEALTVRNIISNLNLCTCGTNAHWRCVYEALMIAKNPGGDGFYRDQWLEFTAKVLDSHDLLDHGSGIGFAWLTDKGETLLRFLEAFGLKDGGFPEWVIDLGWSEVEDPGDAFAVWAGGKAR